ncbi:MAG: acyl-CoA dehydrogenase [Saprospiraceae bacterium]|nr:acyl-CoA dehydrogenase [Saprospiraceae bacterium]
MLDFNWEEEDLIYKNSVVEFAREELDFPVRSYDKEGHFPRDLWTKCATFGIQGLAATKEFGGSFDQINFARAILAMEGLGYGCRDNGLTFGLNAQMWTVQLPILQFGSQHHKDKFLRPLVSGEKIGAHALTEPHAGSDIFNMTCAARPVADGYILNGTKHLITFAPIADLAIVFASVKPELGQWGISAFIVERDMKGLKQSPVREKMGLRTIPIGEYVFKDCFVPTENRLGTEGAGFSILSYSLEYDRGCILASQVGAMQRQLEDTIEFARKRQQFKQSIAKFQSVSNRIVDMKVRLDIAKLLLYKLTWLKHHGKSAMMEAAELKLHLGESFVESSLDAIRTRGGMGYLSENEVERDLRDAIGGVLYAGTSDIQRNIIARLLGL